MELSPVSVKNSRKKSIGDEFEKRVGNITKYFRYSERSAKKKW